MNLFDTTVTALNWSTFFYLTACLLFVIGMASSPGSQGRSNRPLSWGQWSMIIGFALHTFGLLGRWYIGGISRPPWTNLYESLVFFSWGVVAFQVVASYRWKLNILGAISIPLVVILNGMAVMTPTKEVEPLIPALQSYWLKIHVAFGMLSYSGFAIAACIGFLFLMRNGNSLSKVAGGVALMSILNLGIAGGSEGIPQAMTRALSYVGLADRSELPPMGYYVVKSRMADFPDGSRKLVRDQVEDPRQPGRPITRMERLPISSSLYWLAMALMTIASFALFIVPSRKPARDRIYLKGVNEALERGSDFRGWPAQVFRAGVITMLALFGAIGWEIAKNDAITFQHNAYLLILMIMTGFFGLMFLVITMSYSTVLQHLPEPARLDELQYKNILFGFPFQTLLLITGAIWAYYAWGRSWGWDPKETWALITWFAYLVYLHVKMLLRWKPEWLTILSLIGFAIMVFAFLGVNLVLSGLHSYGSS